MRCQLSCLSCKSLFLLRVLYGKHIRSPLFRQWRVHFRLDVQPKRAWSDIVSRVSYPPSQIDAASKVPWPHLGSSPWVKICGIKWFCLVLPHCQSAYVISRRCIWRLIGEGYIVWPTLLYCQVRFFHLFNVFKMSICNLIYKICFINHENIDWTADKMASPLPNLRVLPINFFICM